MSIRLIARDLYRLQKEMDALEMRIEACLPEQIDRLQAQLREIRAEHAHLRRVLDGQIDRPGRRPR